MPDLLRALSDHLVAEEVVRDPRTPGPLPPLWLNPRDGAPAPGEIEGSEGDADLVLSAFLGVRILGEPEQEAFLVHETVDVVIRSRTAPPLPVVEQALTAAVAVDAGAPVGRRNWTMAGLEIVESVLWRGLQPLDSSDQGYTAEVSYRFLHYRE